MWFGNVRVLILVYLTMILLDVIQMVTVREEAEAWNVVKIPIPIMKGDKLSFDRRAVEDAMKHLIGKKVVWIMGKFKSGKSFIADWIRNDLKKSSDALASTIGLSLWYNDEYVLIDSEGMMQPLGENNIYFLKEFLMALMTRAADTLVTVTDQMDVVDMELYESLRSIYWNTNIANMYHIHNCKSLVQSNLDVYQGKIVESLNLDTRYRDEKYKAKSVDHLFLPNLKDCEGTMCVTDYFQRLLVGRRQIDILGDSKHVRQDLNILMYLAAVDDALRALGLADLGTLLNNGATAQLESSVKSPLFSASRKFCKDPMSPRDYYLFIQTPKMNSATVLPGDKEVKVSMLQLNGDFKKQGIDLKISSPVPLVGDAELQCTNTDAGYAVVKLRGVDIPSPVEVCYPNDIPLQFGRCAAVGDNSGWHERIKSLADFVTLFLASNPQAIQQIGELVILIMRRFA
jgi:hypothetical protein